MWILWIFAAIIALACVSGVAYVIGFQKGHREGLEDVSAILSEMQADLDSAREDVEELRKAAHGLSVENVRKDLGDD